MSNTLTVTEVVNSVTVTPINNTVTVSSVGLQGAKGDKGDTGATGATGATGSSGVVTVNAPITNAGTSTAANLSVSTGSTSAVGVLQLTDSVSSTSTTTAATPNSVKTAYDLASSAVSKTALRRLLGQDSSIETIPRFGMVTNIAGASGSVRFVAITPIENMTISAITFVSGDAASSGLTLARFGLYTSDGTNLTLVARTASDTTIFNSINTAYTRSLATAGGYPATYDIIAGTRYYVAIIGVGTNVGRSIFTFTNAGLWGMSPILAYGLGSQTDLPTSAAISSFGASGAIIYGRLS